MRYYTDQKVLLRKNMKLAQIVKQLPNGNYLVAFYEFNKLKYDVIVSENDVIDEDEYEIIRKRINTINKLLDS